MSLAGCKGNAGEDCPTVRNFQSPQESPYSSASDLHPAPSMSDHRKTLNTNKGRQRNRKIIYTFLSNEKTSNQREVSYVCLTRRHFFWLFHYAGVDDQHIGELRGKVHFNLNATFKIQNFTLRKFCFKTSRQYISLSYITSHQKYVIYSD